MLHENRYGVPGPLTEQGWGLSMVRTIYVWGDPRPANGGGFSSDKSTQEFSSYQTQEPCNPPRQGCQITVAILPGWMSTSTSSRPGNYSFSGLVYRVQLTRAYNFIFYANRLGGNSSHVEGFLIDPLEPGSSTRQLSCGMANRLRRLLPPD